MSIPDMTVYETIKVERAGQAVWLTFNRPSRRNTFNAVMLKECGDVIQKVAADSECRALIITGMGDTFCLGSDLEFLVDAFEARNIALFRDYLRRLNDLLLSLEALPVPTIAMVNGSARAAGFELIMACDLVLIAVEASIADGHTTVSHVPGAGASQRAARKIGMQRALELVWSGRWMTGKEAASCGVALKAVPNAELRSTTEALVSAMAVGSREAVAYIKRSILRGWDLPLRDAVNLEMSHYVEYLATSDAPFVGFRKGQEARRQLKDRRGSVHQTKETTRSTDERERGDS